LRVYDQPSAPHHAGLSWNIAGVRQPTRRITVATACGIIGPMKRSLALIPLLALAAAVPAIAGTLVFAISTSSAMPMTGFRDDILIEGLLKDFGDALAHELALEPRYVSLPRKRVEAALRAGKADLLCDVRPEWLESKNWLWTEAVFANNMIVAGRTDTRPLVHLSDLAGERVGTLHGYLYPELERRIGNQFQRDDAATDDVNTTKLLNGRFRYMVSNSLYYNYQQKVHPAGERLHGAVFNIRPFDTYCALSRAGRIDLNKVNRAILALRSRGEMQHIHDRYRRPLTPP
jgi:polar amino acid transport system substrate-binding protein